MARPKRIINSGLCVSMRVANAVRWMATVENKNQKEVVERVMWRAYLRMRRRLAKKQAD